MESIKLTNDYDFALALAGELEPADVRTIDLEALVDTGATTLMLPVVGVKLEIRGREAVVSALVGLAGSAPLIGQIPLEEMDFVVDPKSRELRPNPASPDAPLLDLLRAAS